MSQWPKKIACVNQSLLPIKKQDKQAKKKKTHKDNLFHSMYSTYRYQYNLSSLIHNSKSKKYLETKKLFLITRFSAKLELICCKTWGNCQEAICGLSCLVGCVLLQKYYCVWVHDTVPGPAGGTLLYWVWKPYHPSTIKNILTFETHLPPGILENGLWICTSTHHSVVRPEI